MPPRDQPRLGIVAPGHPAQNGLRSLPKSRQSDIAAASRTAQGLTTRRSDHGPDDAGDARCPAESRWKAVRSKHESTLGLRHHPPPARCFGPWQPRSLVRQCNPGRHRPVHTLASGGLHSWAKYPISAWLSAMVGVTCRPAGDSASQSPDAVTVPSGAWRHHTPPRYGWLVTSAACRTAELALGPAATKASARLLGHCSEAVRRQPAPRLQADRRPAPLAVRHPWASASDRVQPAHIHRLRRQAGKACGHSGPQLDHDLAATP